jgi:uncharacterized RDD family membrane protein YckC
MISENNLSNSAEDNSAEVKNSTTPVSYASFNQRILAFLIDNLIIAGLIIIIISQLPRINFIFILSSKEDFTYFILSIILLHQIYFFLFEIFWDGKTVGKWFLNIKVVTNDYNKLRLSNAFLRNFSRAIYFLPPFFFLPELICLLLTSFKKRIGDLIAGTIILKIS